METFNIHNFIDRLTPTPQRDRYHCPVCQGNNLTIDPKTGAYQCWNGCECRDIRNAIAPLEERQEQVEKPSRPKQDRTWIYTDRQGNPIIRTRRIDDGNGKRKIWQEYLVNGQWISGSKTSEEVKAAAKQAVAPYRYLEVQQAIEQGKPVFWVEGEPCADALWSLGIAATTTIGGSGGYNRGDYSQEFQGADLILCPDRDQAGIKYIDQVAADHPNAQWCYAFPNSPLWERLPKDKGVDIADWVADGASVGDIWGAVGKRRELEADGKQPEQPIDKSARLKLELAAYLKLTDPIEKVLEKGRICSHYQIRKDDFEQACRGMMAAQSTPATRPQPLTMREMLARENASLEFLAAGLPVGTSALLSGLPGAGKTLLAVDLAYAVATGGEFLGEKAKQGNVLFIGSDQPLAVTIRYLSDRGFSAADDSIVAIGADGDLPAWTVKDLDLLEQWVDKYRPKLVIIDSLRTTICYPLGIEEKSELVGYWMREVERITLRYGCSLLWIHHDNKDRDASGVARASGSTAITAVPSAHWRLEAANPKNPENSNKILSMPKTRGFAGERVLLALNPETGAFEYQGREGESPDVARANKSIEEQIFGFLSRKPGVGFEGEELRREFGDNVYKHLSRLVAKGKIGKRPSTINARSKVYFVSGLCSTETGHTTPLDIGHESTPPPPSSHFGTLSGIVITQSQQELQTPDKYRTDTGQIPDRSDTSDELSGIETQSGSHTGQPDKKIPDKRGGEDHRSQTYYKADEQGQPVTPPCQPQPDDRVQYRGRDPLLRHLKGKDLIVKSIQQSEGQIWVTVEIPGNLPQTVPINDLALVQAGASRRKTTGANVRSLVNPIDGAEALSHALPNAPPF